MPVPNKGLSLIDIKHTNSFVESHLGYHLKYTEKLMLFFFVCIFLFFNLNYLFHII